MKKVRVFCRDCAHRVLKDVDRCKKHKELPCKVVNEGNRCGDHALINWGEIKNK